MNKVTIKRFIKSSIQISCDCFGVFVFDTSQLAAGLFIDCQKNNTYGFNKDMVWYLGGVARQTCTGPDDSGTWSLNGNTLTINSQQSGAYQYTITDFNGSLM